MEEVKDKKTLVVGATSNPGRYAFLATTMLSEASYPFELVGIKKGEIEGVNIKNIREKPEFSDIHTITLYIGPRHQPEHIDYLIGLSPKRIIFNPGTENEDFAYRARQSGIETVEACTLVMLRTGQF